MIKIDFNKLKEKNEHVQCIDLTEPENVKKDDCIHITVAHNYSNGDLAYSSSDCKVIGEFYNCDRACKDRACGQKLHPVT